MSQSRPKTKSKSTSSDPSAGPADDLALALNRAGGFLARRAHSRAELRDRLAGRFDPDVVTLALQRLEAHDLIDDATMAAQWVSERKNRRGATALVEELRAKGIAAEVVDSAVAALDEGSQARALAVRLYPKVAAKPAKRQAPALLAMLMRRGFSPEASEAATRSVLPPDGWD